MPCPPKRSTAVLACLALVTVLISVLFCSVVTSEGAFLSGLFQPPTLGIQQADDSSPTGNEPLAIYPRKRLTDIWVVQAPGWSIK